MFSTFNIILVLLIYKKFYLKFFAFRKKKNISKINSAFL